MSDNKCRDDIIEFVMNSSDLDNLLVASFIAGLQTRTAINQIDTDEPQKEFQDNNRQV